MARVEIVRNEIAMGRGRRFERELVAASLPALRTRRSPGILDEGLHAEIEIDAGWTSMSSFLIRRGSGLRRAVRRLCGPRLVEETDGSINGPLARL